MTTNFATCARCDQWLLRPDDVYCSWCGDKLVALEVSPKHVVAMQEQHHDGVDHALRIRNEGQVPLTDVRLQSNARWLAFDPETIDEILPDGECSVGLLLEEGAFPETHAIDEISIITDDATSAVEIELFPPLRISARVEGDPITLVPGSKSINVLLEATSGYLKILDIEEPSADWYQLATKQRLPHVLSSALGSRLAVEAAIDTGVLAGLVDDM